MRQLLARAADGLLEGTVVGSFSRIGSEARSRLFGWRDLSHFSLSGRRVLVTGATSGIGRAAAAEFARLGAHVILLGRSQDKALAAQEEVRRETGNDAVDVVLADLSDHDAVRRAATDVADLAASLDVLVHNAGVLVHDFRRSPHGTELTLAVHVVGPFLLTTLLLPLLGAATPSRVITVSSGGMYTQRLEVDTLEATPKDFDGVTAYAHAKRAQVALTGAWASLARGSGVVFHAMHPGWVDTSGVSEALPRFYGLMGPILRDPSEGADTIVWLGAAVEPLRSNGALWHDRRQRSEHHLPWTRRGDEPAEIARLWAWCIRRAGLDEDERPEAVLDRLRDDRPSGRHS